jgi:hypothetical protein
MLNQTLHPIEGLHSDGPFPQSADHLTLFGQFVGDWELEATLYNPDGSSVAGRGEWHFGWILDGRAIQDVYILRPVNGRVDAAPIAYGTSLRCYDTKVDAWRVAYMNPVNGLLVTFTGRKIAEEIVLDGIDRTGAPIRWVFSDITPQSFHWRVLESNDSGETWHKRAEMAVRRTH